MKKILLVDDNKLGCEPISQDLISTYGFDVTWCDSAKQVLAKLDYFNHDAIILDIMMPIPDDWTDEEKLDAKNGLDTGIVLLRKIRLKYAMKPIIIFTMKDIQIKQDEFTIYLRKPVFIKEIATALNKLLQIE